MLTFTRREILQLLSAALPALAVDCARKTDLEEETFCLHVFHPKKVLPEPLLKKFQSTPARSPSEDYFQTGLPELVLCMTPARLLELFQYFWPISTGEFRGLQKSISVEFQVSRITQAADIEKLSMHLKDQSGSRRPSKSSVAVIFTYNEYTRFWCNAVVEACVTGDVDELVILKDPTRAPYLCDYPSLQKGFKRPPP